MIQTFNGGHVAIGNAFDIKSTTLEQRQRIAERERQLKEWRKSLPRRKKPDWQKPGPVTHIQGRYLPC